MPASCLSRVGWPTALLACLVGLFFQEAYYAHNDCAHFDKEDHRWLVRSADMILIPLTFAMTLEVHPWLGDQKLGLSVRANKRQPPVCCNPECVLPALLVGWSILLIAVAICWIWCSTREALIVGGTGVLCLVAGLWISRFLRSQNVVEEEEEYEISHRNKKYPWEDAPAMSTPGVGPTTMKYDPEDNVLAAVAAPNPKRGRAMLQATEAPKDEYYSKSSSHHLEPEMIKGKSLGAFDFCP